MNARTFPWTEVIVLVLATGALIITAYFSYRRQLENAPRFETYSSYDAHSGGYRAWYELLGREGVRLERFEQRPAFLDSSVSTLIIAPNFREIALRFEKTQRLQGQLQEIDLENLRAWVKRGGRLIWITDATWDSGLDIPQATSIGPARDEAVTVVPSLITTGVDAVAGSSKLRLRFANSALLEPLIADGSGSVVARYALGKGTIVVVTDQSLFDNAHIAKADNARLAYDLAAGGGRGVVAFDEWVHGYASGATWWSILPRPVQVALIITVATLLLLLVSTTLRFGPTARLPDDAERTSAEYLSSMAQLYARGRASRKALDDLATLTLQDVAAGLGLPERATVADIVRRLQSGADGAEHVDQVHELNWLRSVERPTDRELLRAGVLCAALRKEFTRYGRIGFGRRPASVRRSA